MKSYSEYVIRFSMAFFTLSPCSLLNAEKLGEWVDLFNGKDLGGWVDVNTSPKTWWVEDGMLKCSGKPIGVMRSERQYENFLLHVEWRHMEAGGNSGIFAWSDAIPFGNRLPKGLEIQMLELDWVNLNKRKGKTPPIAYVHGELFGAGGMKAIPDNPRGSRSKSLENRCKGSCLLYTSPSPRDRTRSRMPSSA